MASPKAPRRGARRPPSTARRRRLATLLCFGAALWAVLAMIAHLHVRVVRLQRVEKAKRLPVRCPSYSWECELPSWATLVSAATCRYCCVTKAKVRLACTPKCPGKAALPAGGYVCR